MLKIKDIVKNEWEINRDDYFFVTYELEGKKDNRFQAAWDLVLGQSIGNPSVRNEWETPELIKDHAALIISPVSNHGYIEFGNIVPWPKEIKVAFPIKNIDWMYDGISQLLCTIMGGQTDIDSITRCRVVDIQFPESVENLFLKPRFGLIETKEVLGISKDRPLLGGIIKPKTGMNVETLVSMVDQMIDGGIDFIKEDEIMSNPKVCQLQERVPAIVDLLNSKKRKIVYTFCINSDPLNILDRAEFIGNNTERCDSIIGYHANIWSGLGVYKSLRDLDLPCFMHYQKSGDKVITDKNNKFSISWDVLIKLAGLSGCDSIHAGMWGGYLNETEEETRKHLEVALDYDMIPALSCGMHPGLVNKTVNIFGSNLMLNVGGAIHGHPKGTKAGVMAMRQAVDEDYGKEYGEAIAKWGYVK